MANKKKNSEEEKKTNKKLKTKTKLPTKNNQKKSSKKKIKKLPKISKVTEKSKAEIIKELALDKADRKYQRFGLYFHLIFFAIINSIMFLINIFTQTPIWFIWPLVGWGIVLGVHAFMVFVMPTKLEKFEQKYLEKIIQDSLKSKS